ncbi:MAG: HAMP domain-containing protein [Chromatiaceae bacterium]|nr:HAMP domain-containing protein [Chromatiaceae bacterium]MBP8288234.1 HAMP domain-containing protein [Chromatiaceae bacterium]
MRLIPASLFGRLTLILVAGLLVAQFTTVWLHLGDRAWLILRGEIQAAGIPSRFWVHMALTLMAVIAASLIAVRMVTRPMRRLAEAADAFGRALDTPPAPVDGPAETRQATEAFNRMQERLRRLIAERSRALAAVSHDLRTPLTRMRLRAELVEDETLRAEINADIDLMQSMVEATLDYLRGLRDNEPVQGIDIPALLASLAADEQALGRPVTLGVVQAEPYPGRLSALKRAIANLADNAVKYGHEAELSVIDSPDELRVIVEDRGPGIAEADLARVVEPYVRLETSRSRATGGVGLGLAIARDAARLHGGDVRLESRPGGGLRAMLLLPRGHPD